MINLTVHITPVTVKFDPTGPIPIKRMEHHMRALIKQSPLNFFFSVKIPFTDEKEKF